MSFSVDFHELDRFPRGQWNFREGFQGWRQLMCDWGDAATLISELMAYPNNLWPSTYYPAGSEVGVLDDIKWEGMGGVLPHASDDSYNRYEKMILNLVYVTRNFGIHNEVVVSERFSGGFENIPFPAGALTWASTGMPVATGETPARKVAMGVYSLTVHDRLVVPTAVWDLVGCTNNAPWASLLMDRVYGTGTLLYHPPQITRVIKTNGQQAWTYTMPFEIHPIGWNYAWNPDATNSSGGKGDWDYFTHVAGGTVVIQESANLELLKS